MIPHAIEVVTLFATDIAATKAFYRTVFAAETLFEDDVSAVLGFSGLIVNLLARDEAPELVTPAKIAPAGAGPAMMLTIRVEDVDAAAAELREKGISLLNGPIDRPWGRRTAAFADPSGHAWELAQIID